MSSNDKTPVGARESDIRETQLNYLIGGLVIIILELAAMIILLLTLLVRA